MLLNYYTAFLEKHMQGRLGPLISDAGATVFFPNLTSQSKDAMLPLLIHQVGTIIMGSDNTAETGESYNLKKEVTSSLNIALTRSVVDNDDGSHSSIVVANITNISSAPITIGEIGLKKYSEVGYSTYAFIVDRTPLGTPLTIQPGEVGRIVYTITMS